MVSEHPRSFAIIRTSPYRVHARMLLRRLPLRAASGRGLAEVLSRPSWSAWRLLAGVLGAVRCIGGRPRRSPQDERLQGHTKSQPYSDDAPGQPQALALAHSHNRSQHIGGKAKGPTGVASDASDSDVERMKLSQRVPVSAGNVGKTTIAPPRGPRRGQASCPLASSHRRLLARLPLDTGHQASHARRVR